MESLVQKWGNSLGIRIPNVFAKDLNLQEGSTVEITREGDCVVIKSSPDKRLLKKLNQIQPENLHSEHFSDNPKGSEFW